MVTRSIPNNTLLRHKTLFVTKAFFFSFFFHTIEERREKCPPTCAALGAHNDMRCGQNKTAASRLSLPARAREPRHYFGIAMQSDHIPPPGVDFILRNVKKKISGVVMTKKYNWVNFFTSLLSHRLYEACCGHTWTFVYLIFFKNAIIVNTFVGVIHW